MSAFRNFFVRGFLVLKATSYSTRAINTIPNLISADAAVKLSMEKLYKIKFIDGSWHLNKVRNALNEYEMERIPGSKFFDLDAACDLNTELPHMLPSEEIFSEYVTNLGISSDDHVIVYGKQGCMSMPRVWWTFKVFGHDKISIIDGGFEAWKKSGGPVETGQPLNEIKRDVEPFRAVKNSRLIASWKDVFDVVKSGSKQILDARSSARFNADAPDPRPELPRGHIPGSLSLPFTSLLKENDSTAFKSTEEIRTAFQDAGIIFGSDVIMTCGSGVTAAVLAFGMHLLGKDLSTVPIYDGSWTEWGGRSDLPKWSKIDKNEFYDQFRK